jgi:hypothetical protein
VVGQGAGPCPLRPAEVKSCQPEAGLSEAAASSEGIYDVISLRPDSLRDVWHLAIGDPGAERADSRTQFPLLMLEVLPSDSFIKKTPLD